MTNDDITNVCKNHFAHVGERPPPRVSWRWALPSM
jgi:hypothetical protein